MRMPYTSSSTQREFFHQNLCEYLEAGTYCDLTLVVDQREFPCHRVIVASSSPYFQALLTHTFRENSLQSIPLHDIRSDIFADLLQYIYSGKIELDESNVQDLLIASDMIQLNEVVQFCCHYLSIALNEKNVVDVWKLADQFQCTSLRKDAEHYLLMNFRNVLRTDAMKTIPKELLIEIISNDDLVVDHEQQVFEAILVWYCNNPKQPIEPLFDHVRFEYISSEHLRIVLEQIGVVRTRRTPRELKHAILV